MDKLFTINSKNIKKENDLHISIFDDDSEGFHIFEEENNQLLIGYYFAWIFNYPMIISPDIIWLLIMHSFSTHMDKNAEKLRERFVSFYGKKEIKIHSRSGTVRETKY